MEIRILLSRKRKENDTYTWKEYSLKPEEYFDLEILDEGEKLSIESIPLYLEPIDYLAELGESPFEKNDILEIKIVLRHQCKTKIHSVKFWNEGNNCLIEHLDLYPEYYRNMVILGTQIDNKYTETICLQKTIGMETFDISTHILDDINTEEEIYSYSNESYSLD